MRNGAEAVGLAEELCRRTERKQPDALDVLAAAYAETDRFDDAVRTAQEAQHLAVSLQQPELAAALGARLALYQAHQPFRLPAGKSPARTP